MSVTACPMGHATRRRRPEGLARGRVSWSVTGMKGVEIVADQGYFTGSAAELARALDAGLFDACGSLVIEAKLNAVPPEIGRLVRLRELVIATDTLQTIDAGLFRCAALTRLVVLSNQLKELPAGGWGRLAALETLEITTSHALRCLPEDLGAARRLGGELDLGALRKLSALPASFGRLTQVTVLRLPPGVAAPDPIAGMTGLRTLQLQGVSALPGDIGALPQLERVYADDCPLTGLPASIGDAPALRSLSLAGTRLTALPECVTRMPALLDLDLAGTLVTELPEAIGSLRLNRLRLQRTAITRLPASLARPAGDLRIHLSRAQRAAIAASSGDVMAALGDRVVFE